MIDVEALLVDGNVTEGGNVIFVRNSEYIRMEYCMVHSGPIDEVLINRLIVRVIELLVVAAVEELDHAVDDTLGVMGEVDGVGFRFLDPFVSVKRGPSVRDLLGSLQCTWHEGHLMEYKLQACEPRSDGLHT